MTKQEINAVKLRTRLDFRRWIAAAVLLMPLLIVTGGHPAVAGTYAVHQCNYERSITTSSFLWQSSGVPTLIQHANSGCSEFGLAVRTSGIGSAQTYPDSASGGYVSSAPSGTRFTRFAGVFGTLTNCCVTGMEAYAQAEQFASGAGSHNEIFRGSLGSSTWQAPSGSQGPVQVEWNADDAGFSAERVGYFLACDSASGCAQSTLGDLRLRGRSFEFTLDDPFEPEVAEPEGSLISDGWVGGTRNLSIGASDQGGGLAGVTASLDATSVVESPSVCSEVAGRYVELRPCPLVRNGTWTVDTRDFGDGPATLHVRADDAGGATGERIETVKIDNTPPDAPTGVALTGGEGWRNVNDFAVNWNAASEAHAPVSVVHYKVCPLPNGTCEIGSRDGEAGEAMQVEVPQPGHYELQLWFEDAVGNVNPGNASEAVGLRFDDGIPGAAEVVAPSRWLGATQAENPTVSLDLESGAEPISSIAGYSTTTDGSFPDTSIDVYGRTPDYGLGVIPEGVTPVRAVAISGAGTPSAVAPTALVKVDRSAPSVLVDGLPEADVWQTQAVHAEIVSADQPDLSGVGSAPLDRPVTEGGYLALRLDSGIAEEVRGDRATADVATDGHHTLTYQAFDAAGNGSVEREVGFKIDRTAPVGAFRALDVEDPRALMVDVEDVTSGIADGAIEYRREGEGGFKRLATSRAGGLLTARLDDEGLAPGRYEVRAVVTDVAGNEAVIDDWADGSSATLAMPLRLSANISVAGVVKAKGCAKAARKRHGKDGSRKQGPRPKCRRKKAKLKAVTSLELKYGKRATSTGRLVTAQGAAIAAAPIVVEGQLRSGGPFVKVGVARTDAQGNFRFTVPAGPSRTIRYRYDGTNTVRPAAAQLTTKVNAAARLKVDRRRLRNGQAVRFTGRLLGKPIPTAGKLVALQARVGREWRTFATPRANAKGVFKHRYRFTATTGLRRYEFRAVVAREAAYPYEKGVSRIVKVTVRGR